MSSNRVRITHITGERSGKGGLVLSGTVIIHAAVSPVGRSGELVTLEVSTDLDSEVTMRTSRSGSVAFVLDTAQLLNGACDIIVRDLRGNTATRRIRIDNPLSQTGHFYYRDESQPIPNIPGVGGNVPFHSHEYYAFVPIITSSGDEFQINFGAARVGAFPVEIQDIQGKLVRRLSIKAENASQQGSQDRDQHHCYAMLEWDGKDSTGRTVPAGNYQVQVMLPGQPGAAQPLGIIHKTSAQKPARSSQTAGRTSGLRFLGLKERATLVGNVLVQVATPSSGYAMLLLDGELVAASVPPAGQRVVPLALDTARYTNGKHVLEARDFHGHSAQFSVVFQNPISQIRYEPDFDANTGGMGPRVSHFTATLPKSAPWKVTLLNEKGKTVRSFQGNGKTILQAWDGNDNQGKRVPYGRYEILLHAADPSVSDTTLGFIDLHVSSE